MNLWFVGAFVRIFIREQARKGESLVLYGPFSLTTPKSTETARYYKTDLLQFKKYFGIKNPKQYREITAKHITQWKLALQYGPQYKIADKIPKDTPKLIGNGAVARNLSSVSSLFTHYCELGAMKANPFKVISRPSVDNHIGKSKIINEAEARKLLASPCPTPSKASGTGRYYLPSFTTACAGQRFAI